MPVTLIKTSWSSGNLQFKDSSGNVIATFDSANRKITIPSGAAIDLSAAATTLTLASGTVPAAALVANSLVGTQAGSVADANVIGGVPVLHRIDVADAATGNIDVTLTHKTRVVDVWLVNNGTTGVNANTIQVLNGANAISDAMSINGKSAGDVVRSASISPTYHEIAAAGTLRVARTRAGGVAAAIVYVLGVRVA